VDRCRADTSKPGGVPAQSTQKSWTQPNASITQLPCPFPSQQEARVGAKANARYNQLVNLMPLLATRCGRLDAVLRIARFRQFQAARQGRCASQRGDGDVDRHGPGTISAGENTSARVSVNHIGPFEYGP
jgi:hypothetical protein